MTADRLFSPSPKNPSTSFSRGLSLFYAAICLSLLCILLCVPIYADELVWHQILARFFDDGRVVVNKTPQCGSDIDVITPLELLPGRILFSVIYYWIKPPYLFRIIAICVCAIALFLASRLGKEVSRSPSPVESKTSALCLPLLLLGPSLGLAPAFWALGRPEGLFLLCIATTLYLGQRYQRNETQLIGVAGVLLSALCCLAAHPKSIFFIPLFVAIIWLIKIPRGATLIKLSGIALLAKASHAAIGFYGKLYACPDAPLVRGHLSEHMVNPGLALSSPTLYVSKLWSNLLSIGRFPISLIAPKDAVFWGWLPPHDLGHFESIWSTATLVGFWLLFVLAIDALVRGFLRCLRLRHLDGSLLLFGVLFFCELALISHQTIDHHYDGAFHAGIFSLSAFLLWARVGGIDCKLNCSVRRLATILIVINVTCFTISYGKILDGFWNYGVKAEPPSAFHSGIPLFNYTFVESKLQDLSLRCKLDLHKVNGLLVDDSTYPFAQRSYRVLHSMGISWLGADIVDQEKLLTRSHIDAALTRCSSLRPEVVQNAVKLDDFCCRQFK